MKALALVLRKALVTHFLVLLVALAASVWSAADEPAVEPERVFAGATEVIASRLASDPAETGRREVIVTRAEIEELPVASVQDLLTVLPGVGLTRRGARGVQGDLNLRGGSFEQSVVMVNGVRVNNPQTGHHNLDLFIPLAAVQRVEILYGPGSAVHGPDAFGGAINIVTGAPPLEAYLRIGENDLTGGGVAAAASNGLWAALEREVHTGFRDNTEADVNQAAAGWSYNADGRRFDLGVAAGRRRFGAHAFYSTTYPDEREKTSGQMLTASGSMPLGTTTLGFALCLDHHEDDFILDRNRPEFYRNRHTTEGVLVDVSWRGRLGSFDWVAGFEAARDEIDSNNLGRHHRQRGAVFGEVGSLSGPLTYGLQVRLDDQDPWGSVETYAVGGSWRFSSSGRLRLHHGSSFRAPSFTELHYVSPSTVGNPELAPEEGWTTEVGIDFGPWSATAFERRADPIIDYVLGDDGVWRAGNVGELRTRGVDAGVHLPVSGWLAWQRIGAIYLDSDIGVDAERSAYALAHPRLEAAWSGAVKFGEPWRAGWGLRWRDPGAGGSWWTLDLEVGRRILDQVWLKLEASNVFDRPVTELHGIPLPGRWVSVSVMFRRDAHAAITSADRR